MYTDPGALSILIGAVIGFIVGVPMYFLIWKSKLKDWINARRKK